MLKQTLAGALAIAFAVEAHAQPVRAQAQVQAEGYLKPAERLDGARIVPPPPEPGTPAWEDDGETWKRLRALKGTPRWAQAQADNDYSTAALLQGFSCAVGAELSPQRTPATARLLSRAVLDAVESARAAKEVFKRQRPFVPTDGPICVEREPLEKSLSYPSGHATTGWTTALVLSEAAPYRAAEILTRGRAYGESRIVCGVHWKSDVAAGRELASVAVTLLQTNAEFRRDLDMAREELARAQRSGASPSRCPINTSIDELD